MSKVASPRRGFFGTRKPPKSAFGKPLASCELDPKLGVPLTLVQLRAMLFAHNGCNVEGIFRVSPAQSTLKQVRTLPDPTAHIGSGSGTDAPALQPSPRFPPLPALPPFVAPGVRAHAGPARCREECAPKGGRGRA